MSLFVVSTIIVAFATGATATEPPTRCAGTPAAPTTQVWLVDTRCAPGCGDLEAGMARINYWRQAESGGCLQWLASDAAAFHAADDPALPTTVLIHGYGTNADWAVRHGNQLYAAMRRLACGRPFRLVVWSWPADRSTRQVRGIRPDIWMKACRSDAEAYYLARLLSGLPRGEPLSLVGFSLGCRTAGGALHLLAGGTVDSRSLPPASLAAWKSTGAPTRKRVPRGSRPIRAIMLAAAVDENWLGPSAPGGLAPVEVQRILVSSNCRDHVLRWYPRLEGRHGPEALGRVGPADGVPAQWGGKLEVVDLTCEVGRRHDFEHYEESCPIWDRLGWYTFLCGDAEVVENPAKKPDLAANNHTGR